MRLISKLAAATCSGISDTMEAGIEVGVAAVKFQKNLQWILRFYSGLHLEVEL